MLEVEGHVEDVVVQVVDLPSGLPEDDRARRDIDNADGAGVPLGLHVVAVGLPFGDDLHLQRCAAQRTGGTDLLCDGERIGVRPVALIDHQEQVVQARFAHVYRMPVLGGSLPPLGAYHVAGGEIPEISQTDVGEPLLSYGEGHGVVRQTGDGVRRAVYRVHDEDLLPSVVDESDLLAEDVQREAVPLDVHQRGVLGDLVHCRGARAVGAHADLPAPFLGGGDLVYRFLDRIRDGGEVLHRYHARTVDANP